jgi:hypothetical protein
VSVRSHLLTSSAPVITGFSAAPNLAIATSHAAMIVSFAAISIGLTSIAFRNRAAPTGSALAPLSAANLLGASHAAVSANPRSLRAVDARVARRAPRLLPRANLTSLLLVAKSEI